MTPEWQARLAAMVRGFHADMAALERGQPLPVPPLLLEEPRRIRGLKAEVAAVIDAAERPLSAGEIIQRIERRFPRAPNLPSVRSIIDKLFGSCRVEIDDTAGRNRPRYLYSFRQAAE